MLGDGERFRIWWELRVVYLRRVRRWLGGAAWKIFCWWSRRGITGFWTG